MYRAIILPLAKQDISKNAKWYEQKQKGLGKRFLKEIRSKVTYIKNRPKAVVIRYNKIHCVVLEVFPFMIHFSVDDSLKLVVISAVFHTSLDTDTWTKR